MKFGELCETCNRFNEGLYPVVECPICGRDMCNYCANDFLCPECFELKENNQLHATPLYEDGELYSWKRSLDVFSVSKI